MSSPIGVPGPTLVRTSDSAAVVIYVSLSLKPETAMMPAASHLFLVERDAARWKSQNRDYQEVFIGTTTWGRDLRSAMSVRPASYLNSDIMVRSHVTERHDESADANIAMQQTLFTHGFACLARTGHPLIKNGLTLEAFLEAHHVVVTLEGSSQELFEDALAKRGLERRCVLRIPHCMSVPFVVASTDLIGTVSRSVPAFFSGLVEYTAFFLKK
jgi:hypothetical protein